MDSVNGSAPPPAQGPQVVHGNVLPVDPGNTMLSLVPCQLTTSVQQTPVGQRVAATVRTVDTTLTVFLAADEVDSWVEALRTSKGKMSGLILPG